MPGGLLSWDQIPAWVPSGAGGLVLGFLGYLRSKKTDTVTGDRADRAELSAGMNLFIDRLEGDNAHLRTELSACQAERDTTRRELNRMYRKHGENGDQPHPPTEEI